MPNDRAQSRRPFRSDAIVRLQVPEVEAPHPQDPYRPLYDRLMDWPRILVAVNPTMMRTADGRKKITSEIGKLVTLEWNDKKAALTIGIVLRARMKLQRAGDKDPAAKSLANETGISLNQVRKMLTIFHAAERAAAEPRGKLKIPARFTPIDPTAPRGSKNNPIQIAPKDYKAAVRVRRRVGGMVVNGLRNASYILVKHPDVR